jgi:pimeloyl-ACP methyl ester carboxylesterase
MTSNIFGLSEPLNDPTDAVVDIVLIHGLNGHREKTWTDDQVFWPKDLLPADIPKARILAFGYDAIIVHFWSQASQNRIDNHADELFAALVGLRDRTKTNERPIIFVAHSLGGLVCAQVR